MKTIPVIDVFAGPGGLGEGFSAYSDSSTRFDIRLSLEVDPIACSTLQLRTFFHLSQNTSARDAYYSFVEGKIDIGELVRRHKDTWRNAQSRVANVEVGAPRSRLSTHRKIREATAGKDFLLIGGPPCQAYSIVGRSRRLGVGSSSTDSNVSRQRKKLEEKFYSDPKHRLYKEYLEIIGIHRPMAFIMENVKGLSSARTGTDDDKGLMFDLIRGDLENPAKALETIVSQELIDEFGKLRPAKYRLFALAATDLLFNGQPKHAADFVLRCEQYGVPQARHRIIIFGLREDITRIPGALNPSSPVSAREVLAGLPRLRSAVSGDKEDWLSAIKRELWRIPEACQIELNILEILKKIASETSRLRTGSRWISEAPKSSETAVMKWLFDSKLDGVLQHEARSHMASDLVRYLYCAAFANKHKRSPSIEEWPTTLRPAHRNIKSNRGKLKTTGFSDRFKVQGLVGEDRIGRPASTITSHISKDGHYYIHFDPAQCRSLTVREAARLQTFPDNYFFCGNRTQQYHQVGNAVPPFLARQIASIVARVLEN